MVFGREKLKFQITNLFPVTVGNTLPYEFGKFVGLHVFILIHPTRGCERINFTTALQKDKSNPEYTSQMFN